MAPWVPAAIMAGGQVLGAGADLLMHDTGQPDQIWSNNYHASKEFAQHGIRWKVEDARRAGIHPLAALGASTSTFAPTQIGRPNNPKIGRYLAAAGQHIAKGITKEETVFQKQLNEKTLQKMDAEIRLINTQATNFGKQFGVSGMNDIPEEQKYQLAGIPAGLAGFKSPDVLPHGQGIQYGVHGMFQLNERPDGTMAVTISEKMGEILESDTPSWFRHMVYQFMEIGASWIGVTTRTRRVIMNAVPAKEGYYVKWNRLAAAPVYVRNGTPKSEIPKLMSSHANKVQSAWQQGSINRAQKLKELAARYYKKYMKYYNQKVNPYTKYGYVDSWRRGHKKPRQRPYIDLWRFKR